jgi:hypothetical protein
MEKKINGNPQSGPVPAKPFVLPQLTRLGTLRQMTQAFGMVTVDGLPGSSKN